jgi:hypothetical protein
VVWRSICAFRDSSISKHLKKVWGTIFCSMAPKKVLQCLQKEVWLHATHPMKFLQWFKSLKWRVIYVWLQLLKLFLRLRLSGQRVSMCGHRNNGCTRTASMQA